MRAVRGSAPRPAPAACRRCAFRAGRARTRDGIACPRPVPAIRRCRRFSWRGLLVSRLVRVAMSTGVMPARTPDPVTHITMRPNASPMSTSAPVVSLSAVSGRPSHGGNTPGSSTTGNKSHTMIGDQIPVLEPT